MANYFERKLSRSVGTSLTAVGSYTVAAATQVTVIGLDLCNRTAAAIKVSVTLNDGTNDTYLIGGPTISTMGAVIQPGGSLLVVGGDQKVVLEPNDSIKIVSDTASSLDAVMSILRIA